MQITNLTSLNFTANINSPKLKFKQVDFFVPIRGYGKNSLWAEKTKTTADKAVNMIRNNTSGENVLKFIADFVRSPVYSCKHWICPIVHLDLCDHDGPNLTGCSS